MPQWNIIYYWLVVLISVKGFSFLYKATLVCHVLITLFNCIMCFYMISLAMHFNSVFQLLCEWSMQGLWWAFQSVGNICCSTKQIFKGQGLFSDSAPEDEQFRSSGEVKERRKHRTWKNNKDRAERNSECEIRTGIQYKSNKTFSIVAVNIVVL